MKHNIYITFAFILLCKILYAQEEIFIYNGTEKDYFEVNSSVKYIKYYGKQYINNGDILNIFPTTDQVMPDVFKITLNDSEKALFDRKISELDSVFATDELIYEGDGTKQCCFNQILLQTKGSVNLKEILESNNIPYISVERFGLCDNEYLLSLSVSKALYYANKLFETGCFEYAQPSFYRFDVLQNPMYPYQWGLKNTGQYNGVVGMDINVEPAWEISNGDGVTVAVVDSGVQLNHPDLQNNLISGYDATDNGSNGGCISSDTHGTCCTGIIAACDNSIGIKGIAYNSNIIPIRCGIGSVINDNYIINAFNYIKNAEIDIVSCSWGGGSQNNTLINAINYVVTHGRNGLGTIVLFATGNDNSSTISYQAKLPSTIAVGAMSPCGERKSPNTCDGEPWGSNYGTGLDVVAPGVFIPTTTVNSTYVNRFNGTSAACPHAAGVVALMLSANPCLTQKEVRTILLSSCDKIKKDTGYTYFTKNYGLWNEYVGYGKINAHKAVLMALTSGNDIPYIKNSQTTYKIKECELIAFYGDGISGIRPGLYFADIYEITMNISFPYTENPVITGHTNGYSYANPNYANSYMELSNLTNSSATLKTWCFNILCDVYGLTYYSGYTPTAPSNIYFNINLKGLPTNNNVLLTNHSLTSGTWNYTAYDTLTLQKTIAQDTAIINLHAGKCILLQNGVKISPSSGSLRAYIEPFNPCPENSRGNFSDESIDDDIPGNNYTALVKNNNTDTNIYIHPNPNNGSFYVSLSNTEEEISGIRVMDVMGKTVYSNNHFDGGEIVLPNAKQGIYFITLTLQNETITKKMVIQ